jgi:hypothetical protein
MPAMQFVNGAISTTAQSAQTASDVVVTPVSMVGFPSSPQFSLLVRETGELLLVTAITGGTPATWTITRAFGGSTAVAIQAGNHLDYSLTREMLLSGFVAKLDEQGYSADTASGVLTLSVPAGLPFLRQLKVRVQASGTADGYLMFRFNNDAGAVYDTNYLYAGQSFSGTGASQWNGLTFGRCWIGNPGALPALGCDVDLEIGSADATDRWKTWVLRQWLRQSTGNMFIMDLSGRYYPATQAAISTIQLSLDSGSNGVWAAGTWRGGARACLYGVP